MSNRQEQELDAAEYVIGTLSVVERRAFEDLMASDIQTRQDVWYWERAFGALNVSISPEAPPANMWERIYYSLPNNTEQQKKGTAKPVRKKAEIIAAIVPAKKEEKPKAEPQKERIEAANVDREAQRDSQNNTVSVANSAAVSGSAAVPDSEKPNPNKFVSHWWRKLAKLACIIALCLAAYTAFKPREFVEVIVEEQSAKIVEPEKPKAKQYFAVVNADWNQPSLVVRVDADSGAMRIDGSGIASPEGKSLQIWHRSAKVGRKSIGLLGDNIENIRLTTANVGDVLEISIEPKGGAPDGKPSGPIVYSGKLTEFNP